MSMRRTCGRAVVLGIAILASASTLSADHCVWGGTFPPYDGDFDDRWNWSGLHVPDASDVAEFDKTDDYIVTFRRDQSSARLIVSGGDPVFRSIPDAWTYAIGDDLTISGASSLTLQPLLLDVGGGVTVRDDSQLNLNDSSSLAASSLTVGGAGICSVTVDGSLGSLDIQDPGQSSLVGFGGGRAVLTFRNGSTGAFAGPVDLADDMTGSRGYLYVQTGSKVTAAGLHLAASGLAGQTGLVEVTGAESELTISGAGELRVGSSGAGIAELVVGDGGSIGTTSGPTRVDRTGQVNVETGGTLTLGGDLTVRGGYVSRSSAGTLTLGAGGTMTVEDGGRVAVSGYYERTTPGTFTISGTNSAFSTTGRLAFGGGATMSVTDHGALSAGYITIAGASGTGSVTVDGAGSTLTTTSNDGLMWTGPSSGYVTLSNHAAGDVSGQVVLCPSGAPEAHLRVHSGATLTGGDLLIASDGSGTPDSLVEVDGAGSRYTVAGGAVVTVGREVGGTAVLRVQNGGAFATGTGLTTVGATGLVDVTNGTFDVNGDLAISGGTVQVAGGQPGFTAGAVATVRDGGRMTWDGDVTSTGASFVVAGPGSALDVYALEVDNGSVTVTGGASADLEYLNIASHADGTALVEGDESRLDATFLFVGAGVNAGEMTVRDHAVVDAGNTRVPAADAGATGALNISAGGQFQTYGLGAGEASGRVGAISITDSGSALTVTGPDQVPVGSDGDGEGTIHVGLGAAFAIEQADLLLGASGRIAVDGGTVSLATLTAAGGAIDLSCGALALAGPVTLGDGTVLLGGDDRAGIDRLRSVTVGGAATLARLVRLEGGTLSAGSLVNPWLLEFDSGTLRLTAEDLTVGAGGAFGNTLALTAGKRLEVDQAVRVAADGLLLIDGGTLDAGVLDNGGEVALSSPLARIEGGVLVNHGVLGGTGRVGAPLDNRAGGQLRAGAGQRLVLTGDGNLNAGVVEAVGGEVEFPCGLNNLMSTGMILGRDATLRFGTGLTNAGSLALSFGTSDVHGDIANAAAGTVVISGGGGATFFGDLANAGEVRVSAGSTAVFFGDVSGTGSFTGTGTVYLEGDLRPGSSPGATAFGGDVVFGAGGALEIELGGMDAGGTYDQVRVAGEAGLDGTLTLSVIDGFAPAVGDEFDILAAGSVRGRFARTVGAAFGGLVLVRLYEQDRLRLHATYCADANLDGRVGIADLSAVADNYGRHIADWRCGDFNDDGLVGIADLSALADHYGDRAGGGTVPEPAAGALLAAGAFLTIRRRRR